MRFRLFAGLALTLALAGSAFAAGEPVRMPNKNLLDLQSQPERVGDHWRFLSITEDIVAGPRPSRQTNRQTFDLEVIGLSGGAITLRYTLREVEIVDDSQPGIDKAVKAYLGIPIEFEARQGYEPDRITNWPQVRGAYFKALDRLAPGDATERQQLGDYFDVLEADPEELARAVLGDVFVLAGMQQAAAPRDRFVIEPRSIDLGAGHTLVLSGWMGLDSEDPGRCQATWSRETRRVTDAGPQSVDSDLNTTATLSTRDGWGLSLKEVEVTKIGAETESKTIVLTRQGAAPGCG
ncbi:hypothetical protein QO010_004635 [Caulobacter ginsengisoli]|uniref:DUF3108 domain-containing protein n=1 Tax=Caulobacter ginsengisoli TaxID=400775 RepID=A0ABU0IXV3_9CAUL|nr:hypothetical protein [Caulobacter ginsengisoli]MDQ0466839.1 hypothetical protein [Caulobacter ginsengisoli]